MLIAATVSIIVSILIILTVAMALMLLLKEVETHSMTSMTQLSNSFDYTTQIDLARQIIAENKSFSEAVIFHCYWNGELNEKHLISVRSCYYFNVMGHINRKIILWIESSKSGMYDLEFEKYADVKHFDKSTQEAGTIMHNKKYYMNSALSYFSDVVRYILLLKYGGVWFDLDILFLRPMDPILYKFGNAVCVFQWEHQNHPNGALYISIQPNSPNLQTVVQYIMQRDKGWGFQEANLTYDKPLPLLVLPCAWADPSWMKNPYGIDFNSVFDKSDVIWTFDNFFPNVFCYHWHNQWKKPIQSTSIIRQLDNIIIDQLKLKRNAEQVLVA